MSKNLAEEEILETGRKVLIEESTNLCRIAEKLDERFVQAVQLLSRCKGKLVVTGLGKSGHIAQKIAATFSSTGLPAFFLHATEALHGDFGLFNEGDCLLALTFGGETREVIAVATFAKASGYPIIAITGKAESSLSRLATLTLDAGIEKEADAFDVVPTVSSTTALAIGDALAVALMKARKVSLERFAYLHPGGSLGRSLLQIREVMRSEGECAVVFPNSSFAEVVAAVSAPNFGIVGVVDSGKLVGAITDGDIRRALLSEERRCYDLLAADFMSRKPKIATAVQSALDATAIMEENKITSLLVVDSLASRKFVGLVRLHDLLDTHVI